MDTKMEELKMTNDYAKDKYKYDELQGTTNLNNQDNSILTIGGVTQDIVSTATLGGGIHANTWTTLPYTPVSFIVPQRGFKVVADEHRKFPSCDIILPTRADSKSAGYDFYCNEAIVIKPNEQYLFWTDVKSYMGDCEVLQLHVRSSVGIKRKLMLANTTGIIDASYYENPDNDGNIGICLRNIGTEPVVIQGGERIAQGLFTYYLVADEDTTLNDTRTGGIGSSGK